MTENEKQLAYDHLEKFLNFLNCSGVSYFLSRREKDTDQYVNVKIDQSSRKVEGYSGFFVDFNFVKYENNPFFILDKIGIYE